MKHFSAICLCIIVLWLVYWLWPRIQLKTLFTPNQPIDINTISSLLSTVISIVSLIVALWSVSISIKQMKEAETAGKDQLIASKKQQDALDASTEALSRMVNLANEQLAISKNDRKERELEMAKQPSFEMILTLDYYETIFKDKGKDTFLTVIGGTTHSQGPYIYKSEKPLKVIKILRNQTTIDYSSKDAGSNFDANNVPEGSDLMIEKRPTFIDYIHAKRTGKRYFQISAKFRNTGNKKAVNLNCKILDGSNFAAIVEKGSTTWPGLAEYVKTGNEVTFSSFVYFPSEFKEDKKLKIRIELLVENAPTYVYNVPITLVH